MKKVKRMLAETDKSIDTIISECGISNRTEFFKSFYERFGATPLKYRKNQK
jgi:transcriptional regulator GlxA family with amidase domain